MSEQLTFDLPEPSPEEIARAARKSEEHAAEVRALSDALKEKRELRRKYALDIAFARVLGGGGPVRLCLEDGREVLV